MGGFFSARSENTFALYSVSHVSMIILFIVLAVMLYVYREQIRQNVWKKSIRYSLIGVLVLSELSLNIWYTTTNVWNPLDTLPFQLCSISLFLCIFMLVTNSYRVFEVTYFFGLAGASQALLTPELFFDFPHYRYFHFFLAHIGIMLACLYMVWIEKMTPTVKSIWKAIITINVIAFVVFFVNKWTGGNYMFLARKPANPSLIDFLGPYPYYILSLEIVAIVLFSLLYLPIFFAKKNNKQRMPNSA
ncbi:TIGR02206 family membrane protein [Bacillus salitolerans]|uniref:TIGR02206 family membrane protein n=1 Tax=Bacillus salitolerans TaxID=1437434 RepID=A0ABW4LN96_9BACI